MVALPTSLSPRHVQRLHRDVHQVFTRLCPDLPPSRVDLVGGHRNVWSGSLVSVNLVGGVALMVPVAGVAIARWRKGRRAATEPGIPSSNMAESRATESGREAWIDRIREEASRCGRYERPAAVVVFRLEVFDRLVAAGSFDGGRLCRAVVASLRRSARATDVVFGDGSGVVPCPAARSGGDGRARLRRSTHAGAAPVDRDRRYGGAASPRHGQGRPSWPISRPRIASRRRGWSGPRKVGSGRRSSVA